MQISRLLFERMVNIFISPSNALIQFGALTNIRAQPVNVAFTPGLDRTLADVPVQTANINTPMEVSPDRAPTQYTDVLTGERVAAFETFNTPGVFWMTTDGLTFTLFGTRLVSFDGLTLLATQTLPTPVPFAKAMDGALAPRIEFRFPPSMVG